MSKERTLTNPEKKANAPASASGMNRREMVRRLATAVTAAPALTVIAAAPSLAAGKPPASALTGQAEGAEANEGKWKPAFFDPHQYETFTVIAERIVPGSTDAKVAQFIDLLLSVEAQQQQKRFVDALSAFEAYSLATYHKPFINLSEEQQNHALTLASTAKPGGRLPGLGRRPILGPQNAAAGQEEKLTMRDHFEFLKREAAEAYFSSEPGLKYLGWTGQVMWSSFPGCQHPEEHT